MGSGKLKKITAKPRIATPPKAVSLRAILAKTSIPNSKVEYETNEKILCHISSVKTLPGKSGLSLLFEILTYQLLSSCLLGIRRV